MDEKRREARRSAAAFAERWPHLVAKRGFTAIPKCLITCAGELNLQGQESLVLCNIIERYWYADDEIFPKVDTIAGELGKGNSTVRGIIKKLEAKGFLKTTQRYNKSNLYDLKPLMGKLSEHIGNCPKMNPELRHVRKPSGQGRSKSSTQERSDSSTYIENNDYIETNKDIEDHIVNSQRFTGEGDDDTGLGGYAAYMLNDDGYCLKHDWESRDTVESNWDGEDVYMSSSNFSAHLVSFV